MLAVVAVILDHFLRWPSGGFVGVDVFFVISGFLITGILLREHEKTGHISFVGFYRRRAKRILPAATIVLVSTVLAAFAVFNGARAWQTFWDAVWAFFFAANWRFASAGTDYFQAAGPVSPLQHFWSLSVEEQFYFVWPWLMLGLFALAGARGSLVRRRTLSGTLMTVIVVATFVFAMYDSTANPTTAYFSTFTRAWELGFGALIAICAPWWSRIPAVLRPILGWIGLLGIVTSYFVINDALPFPAPWALLPVMTTALVIAAGTGAEQRFLYPLDNPVSSYVGNISYSLYLWHFPVFVIVGAIVAEHVLVVPAAMVLTLFLSALSYHLVEVPIQRSPIGEPLAPGCSWRTRRRVERDAWQQWWMNYRTTYRIGGLALGVAVAGGLSTLAIVHSQTPVVAQPRFALSSSASPTPGATSRFGPEVTSMQSELVSALKATRWPQLDPTLDSVIGGAQAPTDIAACGKVESLPPDQCTWTTGGATKNVLLIGDSTSMAYTEAFRALSVDAGWNISTRGMFGCPFVDMSIRNSDSAIVNACAQHNKDTISLIQQTHPDIVVVTATYETRYTADTDQPVSPDAWSAGVGRYLKQIRASVGKIVLLAPPPSSTNVADCYTPQSSPADCVSTVTDQYSRTAASEMALAGTLGATYVASQDLFCVDRYCPAFVGTVPVKLDLVHITVAEARKIAPALREILAQAGVV